MQTVESIKCNYRAIAKHIMYFVLTLTVSTTLMVPLAGCYILKDFLFISFLRICRLELSRVLFYASFYVRFNFFLIYFDSSLVLNFDTNLQVNPFTDTFFSWFFLVFQIFDDDGDGLLSYQVVYLLFAIVNCFDALLRMRCRHRLTK